MATYIQGLSPTADKIREAETKTTIHQTVSARTLGFLVLCPGETATCYGNKDLCPEVAISVTVFLSKESHCGL